MAESKSVPTEQTIAAGLLSDIALARKTADISLRVQNTEVAIRNWITFTVQSQIAHDFTSGRNAK